MFELCDNLLGIYKTYNTTKSITINPKLYDGEPSEQQPRKLGHFNFSVYIDWFVRFLAAQGGQNEPLERNEVGLESNNASAENAHDSSEGIYYTIRFKDSLASSSFVKWLDI